MIIDQLRVNMKDNSPKQGVASRNLICAKYHAAQMQCASWLHMLEDLFWKYAILRFEYYTLPLNLHSMSNARSRIRFLRVKRLILATTLHN